MKKRKVRVLSVLRLFAMCVVVMVVAVVVALSQINLETLRGRLVSVLSDAAGMPVQIDGKVSWKLSLRPHVELNQVRVENVEGAKEKYAFVADKIDVRLNLISIFRDRPTIQNVRVYNAQLNVEKGRDDKYVWTDLFNGPVKSEASDSVKKVAKYPVRNMILGGVEVKQLVINSAGKKYYLDGFNIRQLHKDEVREFSGWIKIEDKLYPFIVSMSEYNLERKIYPVRVALSTGGDALIANVALEGTSKMPIDFIVRGDIADVDVFSKALNLNFGGLSHLYFDLAGGFDNGKISFRKSKVRLRDTEFVFSGDYDWGKKIPEINLDVYSKYVSLYNLFPNAYRRKRVRPNRELNVFRDVPLFGDVLLNKKVNLRVQFDDFIVYRDMNIKNLNLRGNVLDNQVRIDVNTNYSGGDVVIGVDADIDNDGRIWAQFGLVGRDVYVGQLLHEINIDDFISDLPVDIEMYVRANGRNLSEVMQTITGPVKVYSVAPGYAHSALVAYMYGTDFLTSLRHNIQDLFTSEKKYNQIKISCMALNAKLRDGVFETQNGFAIETNAINVRLAGALNLGDEEMELSLTTVPVRGIKLSLTGNVVNSTEFSGSLAEPDIKISGAAVAGKVASATGLGLLLAPFTGGIGLVAGAGVGLIAGDLLENWLADTHPCQTALERGAPGYADDPEWLNQPISELMNIVLPNSGL